MITNHKVKLRLAVCLVLLQGCNAPDLSPEYSVSSIRLSNGREIFFKREVRGITGERFPFQVIVENHDAHPMEREKFKREYEGMGITRLDLTIDPMIKCR